MGDKNRSEIQKPVKNTLLSGASHGFPFETFQGSSLLIPVSQDSPSVLTDSAGDVNKPENNEFTHSEPLSQITEGVRVTNLQAASHQEESKAQPQASQGYAGLFNSLFGGGQKKQEPEPPVTSTGRSSSPFATVSNIQSFSPALQVPTSDTSTGFSHSSTSPFTPTHGRVRPNLETVGFSGETPAESEKGDFPVGPPSKEPPQSEASQIQNFFKNENNPGLDLVFGSQNVTSSLGFESFYNVAPTTAPPVPGLPKAQSAIELIGGGVPEAPPGGTPSLFSPQSSGPQFYQTRAGSVDSFKSIQHPPSGAPPSLRHGPPPSGPAPPMSSGISLRNYRRDHHKRLAYAPVPGLTSNTAVSSSYLQPCEAFSAPRSVSSSSLSSPAPPPGSMNQSLPGSLSQPALISTGITTSSSNSPPSPSSFFTSPSVPPEAASPQPVVRQSPEYPSPLPPLVSSESKTENDSCENFSSSVTFNPSSNYHPIQPPATGSTHMVSSPAVHPPIMSTKEQSAVRTESSSERSPSPMIIPHSLNQLANLGTSGVIYRPVYHHWFYRVDARDSKEIWQPFSMTDSLALEQAFNSETLTPATVVATDGGRYDVNIVNRTRTAVYWKGEPKAVRRCSWFYRNTTEVRLHPYDENTAYILEEEYKKAVVSNAWGRKVDLPGGDYIIMYGPSSMSLIDSTPQTPDGWDAEPDYSRSTQSRPQVVKRGVLDDFEIEEGESPVVDHLIFVVHGIGSVCDLKFRTIEEAGDLNSLWDVSQIPNLMVGKVDGFRVKALQLIKSHFRSSVEKGLVNRVEILPVSWHSNLHGETTGVDKKLQTITLKSIPRFRSFANDTLLDILFYTSPVYCQNIVHQVGREVNTLFDKFKSRNPNFRGGVSLVGHSLGSLILFDMLCHQKPPSPRMENINEETKASVVEHEVTTIVSPDKKKRSLSRNVSYVIGNAGTGQPFIEYPQLRFQPVAFFALGSPIGMFVTVRGIDSLGLDFCLPTCGRFFNVFHPFDPVAYRIETLVNPELADERPVLIPHHKGRKRMHLELKEKMARVGAGLKQRLVDSVRSTWNTVYQFTLFGRADDGLEEVFDRVIENQLQQGNETVAQCISENEETAFNVGRLNQGRRVDYVLQEAPLESFNEYVSAITSHVIYWDSDDTMLFILREIYGSAGVSPDSQQSTVPSNNEDFPNSAEEDPLDCPSTSMGPGYGFK